MLENACRVAKSARAKAVFVLVDALDHIVLDVEAPKGCPFIPVTRRGPDEIRESFPEELRGMLDRTIHIPKIDMTRMGTIKIGVMLALSKRLIKLGDKIVFLTGSTEMATLDSILIIDTARETEILTTQAIGGIADNVKSEVFQEALNLSIELASRGREGKPIGTIFVLGDEDKVMQLSKQMIINPFKGYTEEERNILNPTLKETLREFSAIDGAFVISGDGLVLTAGRYLSTAGDNESLPQGLGARHIAAAGITALTRAITIAISESTGDVRIFKDGKILMEIEKPVRV